MEIKIKAKNINELMDNLMAEIPQMYVDFHSNKKSGGSKLKWEIVDE